MVHLFNGICFDLKKNISTAAMQEKGNCKARLERKLPRHTEEEASNVAMKAGAAAIAEEEILKEKEACSSTDNPFKDEDDDNAEVNVTSIKDLGCPMAEEATPHNLTHLPHRCWVPICIKARGKDNAHQNVGKDRICQKQTLSFDSQSLGQTPAEDDKDGPQDERIVKTMLEDIRIWDRLMFD